MTVEWREVSDATRRQDPRGYRAAGSRSPCSVPRATGCASPLAVRLCRFAPSSLMRCVLPHAPSPSFVLGWPTPRTPLPARYDQPRLGILLVNLGTPEAPTAAAVRPYLKQFLSDPRVVEIPRALWWLILNGIILNTRAAPIRREVRQDLDRRGLPAQGAHRTAGPAAARLPGRADDRPRWRWNGRCATASRPSRRSCAPARAGVRPGAGHPALSRSTPPAARAAPTTRCSPRLARTCATCRRCAWSSTSTITPATSRRWPRASRTTGRPTAARTSW